MNKKELRQAGALLYVCEGAKLRRDYRGENRYNYSIELTNSDPKVIALFERFLREVLKAPPGRLRGQLFIYPDHDQDKLVRFWSKVSHIPIDQFQKVIQLKQKNSRYKLNPLGTFKLRYASKDDFIKLQGIINEVWRGAGVV